MVFSSHVFLYFFLPLALASYFATPSPRRNLVLLGWSFVFYGWTNPAFVLLLVASILIDWWAGLAMTGGLRRPWNRELPWLPKGQPRSRLQRTVLTLSIVSNLAQLAFFKYHDFGVDSVNAAFAALGLDAWALDSTLRVALPLGISFYTFQSMSYAIDVYRGDARAMRNLGDFACFVAMFPQLVAGPIVRFSEVADQLRERSHTLEKATRGVAFFALGMAKKVLLANPCAEIADAAFGAAPASLGIVNAWLGLIAYSLQIYFDFSGYSDMAIGLGLIFGFTFAKNFDSPYLADSLTDFWRRWHLSLSTWLRDYLYVPLGGSRRGPTRTYVNLALVMLLGGLWHGASWTFVAWGAVHGGALAIERAAGGGLWRRLPRIPRVALTFVVVSLAWVFFRAPTFEHALAYFAQLAGTSTGAPEIARTAADALVRAPFALWMLGVGAIVVWGAPQTWDYTRHLSPARAALCATLFALSLVAMATQGYNPFIYFIF